MPEQPKKTLLKHHAGPIKIRIAPDPPIAHINGTKIDHISTHLFELPVATSVKNVKIEKDPETGEVTIQLSE